MHRTRTTAAAALVLALLVPAGGARAAELLILVQPGCAWCARFDREIAPAYGRTDEGRRAPLRRVDVTQPWPEDLQAVTPDRLTPTFVLLDDNGVERGRLRGYPGDNFFWPLLSEMLAGLKPTKVM